MPTGALIGGYAPQKLNQLLLPPFDGEGTYIRNARFKLDVQKFIDEHPEEGVLMMMNSMYWNRRAGRQVFKADQNSDLI